MTARRPRRLVPPGWTLRVAAAVVLPLVLTSPAAAQDTTAAEDTAPAPDTAPAADTISEVAPEHWPRVTGRLTDRTTGEPIAGATLRFRELGASTVSDSAGRFVLPRVPPGTHELEIRHVGYGIRTVEVTVRADVTTRLVLELEPEAVEVEPIEVRVEFRPEYLREVGFYERMEQGWGNYLDPEEAEQILSPVLEGSRALDRAVGQFALPSTVIRRRRGCGSRDGWKVYVDGRPEEFYSVLDQLRGDEFGAVEVYPHGHGVPAWALSPACGVILVWTERW